MTSLPRSETSSTFSQVFQSPGSWHDELYAVDTQRARYIWRAPIGNVDCSPTVDNGTVFVQIPATTPSAPRYRDVQRCRRVDAHTGYMRWSWRSGFGYFTPTASHEQAIAGLAIDGVLYQAIPATSEFAAFILPVTFAGRFTRTRRSK